MLTHVLNSYCMPAVIRNWNLFTKSCPTLLWPHGLQLAKLLCPWNSLDKNTGVGCHFLLQWVAVAFSSRSSWQGIEPVSLALQVGNDHYLHIMVPSLVAKTVKHLPAMWETWVQSLGREDPLEKEMATHSSTLAWKIPWTKEPGRLQSMGSQRLGHNWAFTYYE